MNLRKTQIINAARDLFIDKGFTNTSMTDIITAAQISKGTFYNHFTSKSECLIAILEESRAEATLLRNELAIGSKLADEDKIEIIGTNKRAKLPLDGNKIKLLSMNNRILFEEYL